MSDPSMPLPARQGLVERIQGILLKPAETWDIIAAEPATIQSIFTGYVVPLAAIGPVCRAIGSSLVGVGMFGVSYHAPWLWSILGAVVGYVLSLVMVYAMAFIVDALAPNFGGQKDRLRAFKLVAYSGTASYVAGVFGLLPALGILILAAALYGIYIFYLGLPKLMRNPADKSIVYIVVIAVCGIVMSMIIGAIGGGVAMMGGGAAMLASGHLAANPGGSFTIQGKDGSATVNLNQMQAAASQMAAQASAMKAGAATSAVKLADPTVLLTLTPATFNGAVRSDTSTSSGGAGGVWAATAEATYAAGSGTIHLKLVDMGSMAGLGAFANAMNVNSSSSSAGGYETVKTEGNRMTSERYNTTDKSGEYNILVDGRINVSAEGSHVDMATLKALVAQIDVNKAEALTR